MKIKVSDFLIKALKDLGVEQAFCITGGASAHLNESLRNSEIKTIHNYHEQACAMAADAYARASKKPALVLVTNGPGVSNTLTGVLAAYQDSIPMIVVSGQVPTKQTLSRAGSALRQFGVQEADAIALVGSIVKFAVQITKPEDVKRHLVQAWLSATTGRMGPVWIEIPLDIQSSLISDDPILSVLPTVRTAGDSTSKDQDVDYCIEQISKSRHPLIIAGAGIHLSNSERVFAEVIEMAGIPVVTTWSASDVIDFHNDLYVGNFGILGQRIANLAIQKSDLLIILGSRMSIPNVGYATHLFSPESIKIMVDIDSNEIEKNSLEIDYPIVSDLSVFLHKLKSGLQKQSLPANKTWSGNLRKWKSELDINLEPHTRTRGKVNSYDFIRLLSQEIVAGDVIVTDMGTSYTCTMQALKNNGFNRLITSSACSPMGFGLPGSIGAYVSSKFKRVICIAGDGGFQMNLQELQTIVQYKIPVKIFILNSDGYLAISNMQDNLFGGSHFGSTPATGVSAPDFARIANAYGIESLSIASLEELNNGGLSKIMDHDGPILCQLFIPENQLMIPRVQSVKDEDGKIVSGAIDLMFPYLETRILESITADLEL